MKKEIIIGILAILIVGGGIFFLKPKNKPEKKFLPTPTPGEEVLPTISEEEFSAILTPRYDKKAVILKITKIPKGTKTIEYEMTYDTDGVERGVMGTIAVKPEDETITREILLGTCSRNVCVYDKNVKEIKLGLRIETDKGFKSWSKDFSLESTE